MKQIIRTAVLALVLSAGIVSIGVATANAANTSTVTQTVSSGTLATDIRDASRVTVASPSFAMGATNFSFSCQSSSGTVGSSTQRIYVDNPNGANAGWTLTLAPTAGPTALWQNGGNTQQYDLNDATGTPAGCGDGADVDTKAGQLTVNATAGTLTTDCASCALTNITKGSSAAFAQGTLDSITLLNAAAASDDVGRWYLTGVTAVQTIPAEQAVDNYTVNLTATATAS